MRNSLLPLVCVLALACGDDDGGTDAAAPADASGDVAAPQDGGALDSTATPDADPADAPSIDAEADAGTDAGSIGSAGCTSGAGLEEGEHTFTLDGYDRRYIVRLPEGYSNERAWPLIFALHGNGGNTGYWDGTSGVRNIRGEFASDAILIIAEAIDNQWRDYSMDSSTWPERIELELNYFDTILDDATSALCIDEQAIFSMGFSGGGSYSGVLGCRREYIRAIAVGGSVIYFDPDDCVSTPAAWITIGQGELQAGRETYRDFFRDLAGCDPATAPTEGCIDYENCGSDTPVTYCTHPAGHEWPSIGTEASAAFFRQFYE